MAKKIIIGFLLDETGSMQSVKAQTIDSFNEYIETLKAEGNASDIRFTLTKFNSLKIEIVHDGVGLQDVEALSRKNYQPANLTPLYDAIGQTIRSLEKKAKKRNVLVVIQTDGQENASKEFSREDIFDLISEKKKGNWTFVFLGADQDAWVTGMALGLDKGNVMSYASAETLGAMRSVSSSTAAYLQSDGTKTAGFFDEEDVDSSSWIAAR